MENTRLSLKPDKRYQKPPSFLKTQFTTTWLEWKETPKDDRNLGDIFFIAQHIYKKSETCHGQKRYRHRKEAKPLLLVGLTILLSSAAFWVELGVVSVDVLSFSGIWNLE